MKVDPMQRVVAGADACLADFVVCAARGSGGRS